MACHTSIFLVAMWPSWRRRNLSTGSILKGGWPGDTFALPGWVKTVTSWPSWAKARAVCQA
jgi:hypothetical protein